MAQYCPLLGQLFAIAGHKVMHREKNFERSTIAIRNMLSDCWKRGFAREKPYSRFYSSLFTDSPEIPINTGVVRGEEWSSTLHNSSPLFTPSGGNKAPHSLFSSRESEELIGLSVSGMLALASHKLESLTYFNLRTQISYQHRILQMKHLEYLGAYHPFALFFLFRHSKTVVDHGLQIIYLEERQIALLNACHLIIGEPIRGLLITKLIHHLCIELVIIDG